MTDDRIDRDRDEADAHAEELDADEDALLNDGEEQPAPIEADDDLGPAR